MSDSDTQNSRKLQDTFNELQAQLVKKRKSTETPSGGDGSTSTEVNIQDIVTGLARREGFEVSHVLGIGGMGAVVRATDMKLKRTVALKFLPPELLNDDRAAELRKEAELASRIQNENVVHILSFHEVDKVPFFAMEFIEGESVEELVRRRGKLPPYEALRIISEAARGVEALHSADIIHRDIKPQNIMIARDGRVKITDFGISRTKDMISEEAHRSKIAGTPKFMSPEQARGEAASKQSDIYSLGATLYYTLTGRSPVEPAPDMRIQLMHVREGRVIPITNVLPKLHRDVARLVMGSMSLKASKRPLDIGLFRKELDHAFLNQRDPQSVTIMKAAVAHWRIIVPFVTLVGGFAAGFYVARHSQVEDYESKDVSSQTLHLLGEARLASLKQIVVLDPTISTDATQLASDMEHALQERRDSRITELIPAADRTVRRWETLRMMESIINDPTSPLKPEAQLRMMALRTADNGEAERIMSEWQPIWFRHLQSHAKAKDEASRTATPTPTAPATGK
ncbi:hypothetical protein BH09SUM1_BH09SUM1_31630 [soil metagenome]